MVTAVVPDPSGTGFIVTQTLKPFSYLQPASSFPRKVSVIDPSGKEVYVVSEPRPAAQAEEQQRPGGRGQQGQPTTSDRPRNLAWHPFGGKLLFLQLEPVPKTSDGKPDTTAKRKDQIVEWNAPYAETDKRTVWSSETQVSSAQLGADGQTYFVTQTIGGKRTVSWVKPSESPTAHKLVEYPADDFYTNPGNLTTTATPAGGTVVRMSADSQSAFLAGTTYDKDPVKNAPRPFLDRINLASGQTKRVFESPADAYETAQVLDQDASRLLVTRQTPKDVPQMHLRDTQKGSSSQLTKNEDHLPDITQARRETLVVTRADGFKFNVRITLPAGSIGKNPAFFWFYPSEFENQAAYDRSDRTLNKNLFRTVRASSPEILLREGYAFVDNDCPIVGPTTAPNDYYVHQLRMNLTATIDALDAAGYIDRTKLAIGGHSYGAFSTANALINTTFFKAGIAGDGNYNRSFTPFGFQSEPRQLWQAKPMYEEVSALLNADRMTGALLMYHGMEDQNMGTDPSHTRRMFQALEALGKPSAMYMYPYEDHGQIAKQTRLDMWARWVAWLDRWVKNPENYEKDPAKEVPPPTYSAQVRTTADGT